MSIFRFKAFEVHQDRCAMKVGTDGVLLGAWAAVAQASAILDIGTGTGVLAMMLAQRNLQAQVHAVEVEAAAFEQAKENIMRCPWANRIEAHHMPVQEFASSYKGPLFEAICCNPPFFEAGKSTAIKNAARQAARVTDLLSFEDLLEAAFGLLAAKGVFSVLLPVQEGERFVALAKTYGFHLAELRKIYPRVGSKKVKRLLIALVKAPVAEPVLVDFYIRKIGKEYHDYTPEYEALHRDFYIIF